MDDRIAKLETQAVFDEWSQLRGTTKRSLDRAKEFADELNLCEALNGIALLGVVGSKGKGTAAIYASATLAAAGLKVGTITSPGLISNRDRVRIDGRDLGDSDYEAMLTKILRARTALVAPSSETGYLSPSGLYMLGGLSAIAEAGCRVAVVEAGIGGISDELSLLNLDGLLVTEIFNEHADILGPTVVDIAKNKVGVVREGTKFVVSVPQSVHVRSVIEEGCQATKTTLHWLERTGVTSPRVTYPPGLSRMNAMAGVRAGTLLTQITTTAPPKPERLRSVIDTVNYPGRLSAHQNGDGVVIVDSAISRDGLVSALVYAKSHIGASPSTVYLAIPKDKDFEGCKEELRGVEGRRVFVDMPDSHLPFPKQADWPWDWIELADLRNDLARDENCLIVGTATFTAYVLDLLGVGSEAVFEVHAGTGQGC